MSYTYLQRPGEESSAECFSDIEPFVRSKVKRVLLQHNATGCCRGSPIWMTMRTFDRKPWAGIVDVVCGGFPMPGHQRYGKAQESTERSGLWGPSKHIHCARFDPVTSSWKTRQLSFYRGLGRCAWRPFQMGFDAR